jgi:hypothetical protein
MIRRRRTRTILWRESEGPRSTVYGPRSQVPRCYKLMELAGTEGAPRDRRP